MIILLGLALLLVWHVYAHHTRDSNPSPLSVVSVDPGDMACRLL